MKKPMSSWMAVKNRISLVPRDMPYFIQTKTMRRVTQYSSRQILQLRITASAATKHNRPPTACVRPLLGVIKRASLVGYRTHSLPSQTTVAALPSPTSALTRCTNRSTRWRRVEAVRSASSLAISNRQLSRRWERSWGLIRPSRQLPPINPQRRVQRLREGASLRQT